MIQKFRQHIVPFIITVRKILSVVLSILWFGHDINSYQILGIVVVFLAAIFDFLYGKYCDNKSHQTK
jgi:drug/metabolite transporter (DMT)-like permease